MGFIFEGIFRVGKIHDDHDEDEDEDNADDERRNNGTTERWNDGRGNNILRERRTEETTECGNDTTSALFKNLVINNNTRDSGPQQFKSDVERHPFGHAWSHLLYDH